MGKTTLVALLAAALSGAGHIGGVPVETGGRLLYAHLEHQERDFASKLEMAARGGGIPLHQLPVHIDTRLDLDSEESIAEMADHADKNDVRVVVVDPLRRAGRFDENSSSEVAEVGRRLRSLTGEGRRLVIGVHHLGKNHSVRGSSDWPAQVDSVVRLIRSGEVLTLDAQHHGGRDTRVKLRVRYVGDEVLAERIVDSSGPHKEDGLEAALLAALAQGALNTAGLRKAVREGGLRASNDAIDATARRLETEGRLRRAREGRQERWTTTGKASMPPGEE